MDRGSNMSHKVTIRIKKRSQAEWLMWLLLMLPFVFGTCIEILHFPRVVRYIPDVAWVWLLVLMFRKQRSTDRVYMSGAALWILVYVLYTGLVYVLQYQSPFYFLWGTRINVRYYVAFFAFVAFLSHRDVKDYLRIFDILFWVNFAVSLLQYCVLAIKQDNLGGLFGTESGVNGYTNIFFLIVVSKSLIFYLNGRERGRDCVMKCAAALLVAALSELKFFFAEFVLVIVLASLATRFTWKKLGMIIGGCVAVIMGAALLTQLFPDFADFFSVEWFMETALSGKGYTSAGDLNRMNAIPQINEMWLKTGWQRIFGLGLGNCDTSGFAFLNTPFFEKYGDMHYTWLSYAMIYLETGWIGLIFYFGFFLLVYRGICRIQKRVQREAASYCQIGRIMAILCMVISIYNSSLRTEAGYMAYFVLAIPFVVDKRRCNAEVINAEKAD